LHACDFVKLVALESRYNLFHYNGFQTKPDLHAITYQRRIMEPSMKSVTTNQLSTPCLQVHLEAKNPGKYAFTRAE
jgi:hypothetical protein